MAVSEVEKLSVPGAMKMEPGSRIGLTGEDTDFHLLNRLKAEALIPIQEDLAAWLNKILGEDVDITAENFLERLDSGVHLCRLAEIIEEKRKEGARANQQGSDSVGHGIRFRRNATSGSWLARDNTTNFIVWCRSVGIKDECLFETEGLVLHRDLRNVVLCLLEVARVGAEYGLELPAILKLEKELDMEEQSHSSQSTDDVDAKVQVKVVKDQPRKKAKTPTASKERIQSPKIASKSEKSDQNDRLHKQVMLMSGKCCCKDSCNQLRQISHGRYLLGKKVIYVGMLNDRHLMVRVGGGWDTLEHYLAVHDPCKVKEFRRKDDNVPFLHVQGKYKPSKKS